MVFEDGNFRKANDVGNHILLDDFTNQHLSAVISAAGKISRPVNAVIDSANAVPGPFMVTLAEMLGSTGETIHCQWDNTFPNHPPDPTRPKNMVDLAEAVVASGAEFGVGVDGDGDRIGVVDEEVDSSTLIAY